MSTENTNNKDNKQQKKERLRIRVDDYVPFNPILEESFENTAKISKMINKILGSAFVDYHGSAIFINPGNGNPMTAQMAVELYFKPFSESQAAEGDNKSIRAFKMIGEGSDDSRIAAQLRAINSLNRNINFEITSEGAQILSEFMIPGFNIDPFNPNTFRNHVNQFQDNNGYTNGPIYIKLLNVDLTKLLRIIYGPSMSNGTPADYLVLPQSPVNPAMLNSQISNPYINWRLKIMKASKEKVNELLAEMGATGRSPIVTGW